jgi:hypothetical protein
MSTLESESAQTMPTAWRTEVSAEEILEDSTTSQTIMHNYIPVEYFDQYPKKIIFYFSETA